MNAAHWHLLLNHLPVVGVLAGFLLLLSSFIFKNNTLAYAGLVALIISALLAIPVFLTGEPAEEILENVVNVNSETAIESHEEAAEITMIAVQVLGTLSIITVVLMMQEKSLSRFILQFTTFCTLVVFGMLIRTANLGGEISHSEIRSGIINNAAGNNSLNDAGEDDD